MKKTISKEEFCRLNSMFLLEKDLLKKGYKKIAGIDEAGRGPLAGPVVAACCILNDFLIEGLNDSKKLDFKKRNEVYEKLKKTKAKFSFAVIDSEVIDKINILNATILAMEQAKKQLSEEPDFILVDGLSIPNFKIPTKGIKEGDKISLSIAAASIIAKCERDAIMIKYNNIWPKYGFLDNKGYGTKKHMEAIKRYGPCKIHRTSFEPVKSMVKKFI
ncbi:MAG: hypothetical protein AMS24_01975 [Chlamydiae bacterium SM23_39]|nr:MAG: hypothetical protein AMS24_01975 [Chlamydiae bacterium SM23_39]